MNYNNVLVEEKGNIAVVTVNRPKQLNALNKETISELSDAFRALDGNTAVRAIVLTGSGDKAFVAGADIKEFADFDTAQGAELSKKGHDTLFNLVENLGTPVIAAVNGFALGGGLELAMSSHIRIASDNAKVGLPEVTLGVIPGYGGTQRLAQLAGRGKAMEMVLSGGMISAEEAHNWGIVNNVYPQAELLEQAEKLAGKIARNSSSANRAAIRAINANYTSEDGFAVEIEQFGNCFGTPDFVEGTTAFVEKRKPNFK